MTDSPDPFTPTGADRTALPDAATFRANRSALIELLESLPETRLSTATPRHGWTLRHELAWLAAADLELMTRIQLASGQATEEPQWRRLRGEAMHLAQETGEQAAKTLEAHPDAVSDAAVRATLTDHTRATGSATAVVEGIVAR